jgi:hypothetical protein
VWDTVFCQTVKGISEAALTYQFQGSTRHPQ